VSRLFPLYFLSLRTATKERDCPMHYLTRHSENCSPAFSNCLRGNTLERAVAREWPALAFSAGSQHLERSGRTYVIMYPGSPWRDLPDASKLARMLKSGALNAVRDRLFAGGLEENGRSKCATLTLDYTAGTVRTL
jgi:hypothetical protein